MGVILCRWEMDMVFDTPDKCRMETMAIAIIRRISLIVEMTNTVNVDMVEKVEAMGSIDVIMTMID
ncbi:MAG: hypothetical protein PHF31_07825 [Methylobacter sp.]|nr:hypothetical protein [Methylobacter sp.]